ncbi:hypothetical protein N806_04875 [Rhodococcus sp. P27]|nr:hypothetical protein N806_04875 [Rhodococcus sp. P27]
MNCDYIDPDLRRLFDFQHGLATNKQLRPFGYSPRRIQHLVESGQWTSVLHGVQSSTNGPLNRAMILEAALLFGGGETYLSHRTAAEEWGLTHIESELPVHITVRYGRSSRCQSPTVRPERSPARPVPLGWSTAHPGVIVHRSRAQAHIGVATQLLVLRWPTPQLTWRLQSRRLATPLVLWSDRPRRARCPGWSYAPEWNAAGRGDMSKRCPRRWTSWIAASSRYSNIATQSKSSAHTVYRKRDGNRRSSSMGELSTRTSTTAIAVSH